MAEPEEKPSNVHDIWTGRPTDKCLDDEYFQIEKERTLKTLEELKEAVEKDECVGIAIVMGHRHGMNRELTNVTTVFSGAASEYSATFMGGLDILKQRIYEDNL